MLGVEIDYTLKRMQDTITSILNANNRELAKEYLFIKEKYYDNENFLTIIDSLFLTALPSFKKEKFDEEVRSVLIDSELRGIPLFSWIHGLPNKEDLLLIDKLPDYGDSYSLKDAKQMIEDEGISEYDGDGYWVLKDTRNSQLFKIDLEFDSFDTKGTLNEINDLHSSLPKYIEMSLIWFNR